MSKFVIDASLAAKWVFLEKNSDAAEQVLKEYEAFIVPDLFYIEMDGVISKKVRKRELDSFQAHKKRAQVQKIAVERISHEIVAGLAFDISISLPVTIFDAIYLALAVEKEAVLWTADDRLVRGLSETLFKGYIENPLT